jgi:hypothetical protein
MTTAVATKNTALALSATELSELQAERDKMGSRFPTIPQIRLANKDMKQAPEGEYFIERKRGKDEEPEITPIGPGPEITILYKTSTYSYFTKEDGLIAWTSDIHGFTHMDDVVLFLKKDGQVVIDFEGNYPAFKTHMQAKYVTVDPVTDKTKKLLKFKTVLYVCYQGQVYKMFVSNASSAGVDLDGNPSFDKPQDDSLQAITDSYWSAKRLSYEFKVRLGSRYVESSKPYYIMTFSPAGELDAESLRLSWKLSKDTQKAIHLIDQARRPQEAKPIETAVDYTSDVNPEDLPF